MIAHMRSKKYSRIGEMDFCLLAANLEYSLAMSASASAAHF